MDFDDNLAQYGAASAAYAEETMMNQDNDTDTMGVPSVAIPVSDQAPLARLMGITAKFLEGHNIELAMTVIGVIAAYALLVYWVVTSMPGVL